MGTNRHGRSSFLGLGQKYRYGLLKIPGSRDGRMHLCCIDMNCTDESANIEQNAMIGFTNKDFISAAGSKVSPLCQHE